MTTEPDEMMSLSGIHRHLVNTTVPGLDALAKEFEGAARKYIADAPAHAFFSRLATVINDFALNLKHALAALPPELRARIEAGE